MLKIKNFLCCVVFIPLLTSCSFLAVVPSKECTAVLNNQKSIVVFSTNAIGRSWIGDYTYFSADWENLADKNNIIPTKPYMLLTDTHTFHSYPAEPGTYNLSSVTSYYHSGSILKETTVFVDSPIRFTINAGEVIYIGHIEFRENGTIVNISDQYSEALLHSKRMFPTLNHKFQKRLILRGLSPE